MGIFTDGSSLMDQGQQKAGYTEIISQGTLEVGALPPDTFTQKAKLRALGGLVS